MRLADDVSISTVAAGFVAALVGLTSSIAIVFAAATALGASDEVITSWVWAICVGMGLLTIVPSWRLRVPVMVAYSTPGAVIIATLNPGDFTLAEGVGAFIVSGLAVAVVGLSGAFQQLMRRIPTPLASALLAGALTRFAITGFADASTAPGLVVTCTLVYFIARRIAPRYAVIAVLAAGIATAALSDTLQTSALRWSLARPVFTAPSFTVSGVVAIAIPLFIVTMAGQNLPGAAVIRQFGYQPPVSRIVGLTGVGSMALAPFGGYALNLSAITAALCMGPGAHDNPERRYTAAMACGGFYLLAGIFGTSITGALSAFPAELVHIIAGLALLPTIAANLATATADEHRRDAAVVTFVVTLSGVTITQIGSPLWGLLAGLVAMAAEWRHGVTSAADGADPTEPDR